jgi:hypothetical protein
MGNLIKLATWALIEFGKAGDVRPGATRVAAVALCAGLAALSLLAALGCAAAALWIGLLPVLGAVGAPLVVAAGLAASALSLAASAWLVMRDRRPRAEPTMMPDLVPPELASEATRLFREHKGAVLLAALVAGMTVAQGGRKS